MFVRWVLFETRIGEAFHTLLERRVGLAVVEESWLSKHPTGRMKASAEAK